MQKADRILTSDRHWTSCQGGDTIFPPSPPPLRAAEQTQRSSTFPRRIRSHADCCSRLTRQHDGEQSGLVTLTFDLLTLKVVLESRVTWATSVPILVFLGLSVLDLGLMHVTDVRQKHCLMPPPIRGGDIINNTGYHQTLNGYSTKPT